jgi:hypothetical protein
MKKKIYKLRTLCVFLILPFLHSSCMKEFLDVKRNKTQVIPESLEDYQHLLDHSDMHGFTSYLLGEVGSDDYYVLGDQWRGISVPAQKNAYVWADDIYEGEPGDDWNRGYQKILNANFVLEGASKIVESSTNKPLRDAVLGAAYFHRGTNLFLLAQLFCKQYEAATSDQDMGLPLRTTSNLNTQFQRATLEETYQQILADLERAVTLLPTAVPVNTRPSKAAALGMLANVQLQKAEYVSALSHANAALSIASTITDFNTVNTAANAPFQLYGQGNPEIIFYNHFTNPTILAQSRLIVDSLLYASYHTHDLRKSAFFRLLNNQYTFKGHYSGITAFMFSGLTTTELYLVQAECNTRIGDLGEAVSSLNKLLEKRFSNQNFIPISNDISQPELLDIVLSERRKELIFRGRRWHDLKRFAADPEFAKPLRRILDGTEYTLPIGSPRWVWPIPPDAINQGGYKQNER